MSQYLPFFLSCISAITLLGPHECFLVFPFFQETYSCCVFVICFVAEFGQLLCGYSCCAASHSPACLLFLPHIPILLAAKEFLIYGWKGQFQPHSGPLVSESNRLIKNSLKTRTALCMKGLSSTSMSNSCPAGHVPRSGPLTADLTCLI